MKTRNLLRKISACKEAQEWASQYDTIEEAWAACPRGDWLLWLWAHHCGKSMDDRRRPLVLAAAECARPALPTFEQRHPNDRRPREALDIAEKWGRGEAVTRRDIVDAVASASNAAYDTHALYADYAAADAAYATASAAACASDAAAAEADDAAAARASDAAAYAAAVHASAAYDAAYATHEAATSAISAYEAARSATLARCANIVRRHMPTPSFVQETVP
jgi:hypothetical protein